MTILGINTALPITEVALIQGDKTVLEKNWQSNYDEAEKMLPELIQALPKDQGLDQIFVVSGPGSYTGLRIGVTAANTIGMLKSAQISSLGTFDFIHSRLPNSEKTAVILKAGGQNVAVTSTMEEEPVQMPVGDAAKYLQQNQISCFFTERDEIAEQLAGSFNRIIYDQLLPFDQFLRSLPEKSLPQQKLVKPYYLNPPQITPSKNALRRSNADR